MLKDLWHKGRALWADFSKISAATYASSISYFTFLSLVPLIAICISLLSVVGISEQDVISFFVSFAPDMFKDLIGTIVSEAFASSGVAFSLSTITLLWSASKGAKALRVGLNASFEQEETRSAVVVVIKSMLAGLVLDLVLALTMYLVFSGSVFHALAGIAPGLEEQNTATSVLNWLATMALGVVTIAACYAYLPAGRRRLITQMPGAIFTTLAGTVLSFGYRIYVEHFSNYTVIYGSLATIALLLFWMYLLSYILIIGGFINRRLSDRATSRPTQDG